MEKRIAGIFGLVGGILAIVSLVLAWASSSGGSAMGIDFMESASECLHAPILLLVGGILALVAGIVLLATKVRAGGYLLPIGGMLALIGGILGFAKAVAVGAVMWGAVSVSVGYGIYVGLVGTVIILIGGGLSNKSSF